MVTASATFAGFTDRLDYLCRLGVDCVWLLPFYPTSGRDNGYDVTDYYGVNDRFGDLGDFAEFLNEAESRGIRVLTDLIANHTSDRHPWVQRARENLDYYVWPMTLTPPRSTPRRSSPVRRRASGPTTTRPRRTTSTGSTTSNPASTSLTPTCARRYHVASEGGRSGGESR